MKRTVRTAASDAGQMCFTYRRSLSERLASGELRDVSAQGKGAGFRWPLAVSRTLWSDTETVPGAHRRTETAKTRWQHLFLLASPAAAQMQREGKQSAEINVVLRTTDAPERDRAHIKTLVLRREHDDSQGADRQMFTLEYKRE